MVGCLFPLANSHPKNLHWNFHHRFGEATSPSSAATPASIFCRLRQEWMGDFHRVSLNANLLIPWEATYTSLRSAQRTPDTVSRVPISAHMFFIFPRQPSVPTQCPQHQILMDILSVLQLWGMMESGNHREWRQIENGGGHMSSGEFLIYVSLRSKGLLPSSRVCATGSWWLTGSYGRIYLEARAKVGAGGLFFNLSF